MQLNALRCRIKGHVFVDSRSVPGTKVCTRCRLREPFEGLKKPPTGATG